MAGSGVLLDTMPVIGRRMSRNSVRRPAAAPHALPVRVSHHARSPPCRAGIAAAVVPPGLSAGAAGSASCLALNSSRLLCGAAVGSSSESAIAKPAALAAILNFSIPMHLRPCSQFSTGPTANQIDCGDCRTASLMLRRKYRPSRFFFCYFLRQLMMLQRNFEFVLQLVPHLTA